MYVAIYRIEDIFFSLHYNCIAFYYKLLIKKNECGI